VADLSWAATVRLVHERAGFCCEYCQTCQEIIGQAMHVEHFDPISKALPTIHLGGRKAEDSYATLHDFTQRLAPGCIPAFTTDGLRSYFSAITAHMGEWVEKQRARKLHWKPHDQLLYGQLVKRREKHKVTYTLTRMRWGKRSDLYTILENHGFSKNIHTAFIERVNLTIRQGVSLLTRKTWSLPQSDQQLLLHLQWWRAYYHFIRAHESLREPIPGFKRKFNPRTPAMAGLFSSKKACKFWASVMR
jgi:IS1 family transposase